MNPFVLNETNTFCINIKANRERWEKMEQKFLHYDMKVTRWEASTAQDVKDPFPDYLSDGQKGCSQSHIDIWRHIVENNLDYALILEDDACLDREWKQKLQLFCKDNTDDEWDALFLNASEPIEPLNTWVGIREQYLTGGYIISNQGSRKQLNDFQNMFFASDWMTSRLQIYGHSYSYFPWLIIQEGKESIIGSNIEADHEKVVKCLEEIQYSLDNYV